MIPFAKWLPDQADLNQSVATVARNVTPLINGYAPFSELETYSLALPAKCAGMFSVRTSSGDYRIFAATRTKLYKLNASTLAWDDVSRVSGGAYNAPVDDIWWGVQFGNRLIVGNVTDATQYIEIDAGTNFAALPNAPSGRCGTVIGDYVMIGSLSTDANAVHWSGTNDTEAWTIGTAGSDTQSFADGGWVVGFGGGEAGYILQESVIRRTIVSPNTDFVFEFEKIEEERGAISPGAIVTVGALTFFLAEDGFYALSGTASTPISATKVSKYFFDNVDQDKLWGVQGAFDSLGRRVLWPYSSTDNVGDYNDRMLCYSLETNDFTEIRKNTEFILGVATQGVTLEGLDALYPSGVDSIPVSLDSRIFLGGRPVLGAIDTDHKLGFFSGDPMEATLETGEFRPIPGYRAFVNSIEPECDAEDAYISVRTRESLKVAGSWGNESTLEDTGEASILASSKYFKVRKRIPAGTSWTYSLGVNVNAIADGKR